LVKRRGLKGAALAQISGEGGKRANSGMQNSQKATTNETEVGDG